MSDERHRIWRIATRGPTWRADDLSGSAAAQDPGRWNSSGVPVDYASTSIALACLETLVHLSGDQGLPLQCWIGGQQSLLAAVPSVIVPEEHNVLINPAHPGLRDLKARVIRRWPAQR